MHDPLQRLYKTKMALLAVVLTVAGLALLILKQWVADTEVLPWLRHWPIADLGSGLFTAGLLSVALTYLDAKDGKPGRRSGFIASSKLRPQRSGTL